MGVMMKHKFSKISQLLWAILSTVTYSILMLPAGFSNIDSVYEGITNGTSGFYLTGLVTLLIFFFSYIIFNESSKQSGGHNHKLMIGLSVFYTLCTLMGITYSRFNSWSMFFSNIWALISFVFMVIVLTKVFYSVLLVISSKIEKLRTLIIDPVINNESMWRLGLQTFLIMVIGCLAWLLVFYPGNVLGDGFMQLDMYFGFKVPTYNNVVIPMSNHHPYLSTLFQGFIVSLGRRVNDNFGIFLFNLVQIIIVNLINSFVLIQIRKLAIKRIIVIAISVILGFYPFWAGFNIELGKEGLFFAFFSWFTIETVLIIKKSLNNEIIHWPNLLRVVLSGLLVSFWRNNGIYSVVPTVVCLLFINHKLYLKKILVVLVSILAVYGLFNKVALPLLNVQKSQVSEALSIPSEQTARYLKYYPNDISKDERQTLKRTFQDYRKLPSAYDPLISDNVKGQFRNLTTSELKDYLKAWFSMGLKHPGLYVQSFINGTFYYYYPWSISPNTVFRASGISDWSKPKALKVYYQSPKKARDIVNKLTSILNSIPISTIIINAALYFWVILFMVCDLIGKRKYQMIVPFIPVLLNVLVCIASPVNGEIRYSGVIQICTFILGSFWLFYRDGKLDSVGN